MFQVPLGEGGEGRRKTTFPRRQSRGLGNDALSSGRSWESRGGTSDVWSLGSSPASPAVHGFGQKRAPLNLEERRRRSPRTEDPLPPSLRSAFSFAAE